jgi:hypothetical protein
MVPEDPVVICSLLTLQLLDIFYPISNEYDYFLSYNTSFISYIYKKYFCLLTLDVYLLWFLYINVFLPFLNTYILL